MPAPTVTVPDAVTDYLAALHDPASLMDNTRIAEIQATLDDDEIAAGVRLDLMLQLRTLRRVDLDALKTAFLKAVPKYVAEYGLDLADVRDDFLAVGVPPEVADAALAGGRQHRTDLAGVAADDVAAHVLSRRGTFTTKDLLAATGASRGTVTKVLKQLIEDGSVHAKQGRPIIYSLS